ncbi:MAG: cyclic nucleotide-binding domain-containing protein [Akkermansiaceae bacterium]|nr:cyclic nucleotide-binding domain-containing protein [Akkermansiaceae bacterium]NNM30788.1 cyclic nucleotide-binding domain-containing protein [Akkermansiaceae bacterium]
MSTEFNKPELPALGILAALDDADRRLLSDYGEFLPVQADAQLIEEGSPQNSLYFVISGVLHVTTDVDGKRTLISRAEPGETIGEVSVFDPGKASATVHAQEFCQVWRASREDIDAFLASYPEAAGRLLLGMLGVLCGRLRNTTEKLTAKEQQVALRYLYQ